MDKLKMVAVEPGVEGYESTMDLKEVESFIEGPMVQVHLYDDIFALINENGLLLELPHNRSMILQDKGFIPLHVVGKFVVVKSDGNKFLDLNQFELDEAKYIFRNPSQDATIFI